MFVVVVVLYNCLPKDYQHLCQRNDNIRLIFVDNTPQRDLAISDKYINYIPLGDNMGIAYALNIGCRYAMEKYEADWVLTLDQDSDITAEMIDGYSKFIRANDVRRVGLLCPLINVYHGENKIMSDTTTEVDIAITSGSFLNMKAYREIGGFKDELFIDEVDTEYCLNLKIHGFVIFQLNYILMQHQVGNCKEYKLFGKHMFYVLHHNFIRHYYMQRNSLYVSDMYSDIYPSIKKGLFQQILPLIKIILFENDKSRKIKYRFKGYRDYKNHRLGKL